jgi:hypothetical protein
MLIRQLLAEPGSWRSGLPARDKDGNHVDVFDDEACSWCVYGAMIRCYPPDAHPTVLRKLNNYAIEVVRSVGIINWEGCPSRTHADIRAMLDHVKV